MKSSLEKLLDWLTKNHPEAMPNEGMIEDLKMWEKIEQQLNYNAGFSKARSIYHDGAADTRKADKRA